LADEWEDVLDRLEADLDAVERRLRDPEAPAVEPWALPSDLGPLPERLVRRAVALSERQETLAGLLGQRRTTAGRHLAVVRSVPAGRPAAPALYLDVEG
jgi:hypothetical protein